MTEHDFSRFLSAVAPNKRTGRYLILGALYCLEATKNAVTAKQVTDLLKLHLGSGAPVNIPAQLAKYTGHVRAESIGPPRLWKLTNQGVEELRKLSALELREDSDADNFDSDVGIICALDHPEFSAVVDALGGLEAWQDIGNARFSHLYREAALETSGNQVLRIVGTTSTSMGLTAAAIATTHLVLRFRPRIVVMIGVAAGTRSRDKEFGDVLVADPSIDYNSGKVVLQDGIRDFLPDPYPLGLNARLRSVLHRYRGNTDAFSSIRSKWDRKVPLRPNRLHVGPVGAADQVIDDPTRIIEIQKNWRKLIGVEMETYGVYRACHEAPDPKPRFVSFKAVCDFAAEKSDSWQDYAAFMAAEFAMHFLRNDWDALWPTSAKEKT